MTRINLVSPSSLSRQHLIAEYRELPRIFAQSSAAWSRGDQGPFPPEYTLGKGHVRFFYDKLLFLYKRQQSLYDEMLARGYSPQFHPRGLLDIVDNVPPIWFNDYTPTPEAIDINLARIAERTSS